MRNIGLAVKHSAEILQQCWKRTVGGSWLIDETDEAHCCVKARNFEAIFERDGQAIKWWQWFRRITLSLLIHGPGCCNSFRKHDLSQTIGHLLNNGSSLAKGSDDIFDSENTISDLLHNSNCIVLFGDVEFSFAEQTTVAWDTEQASQTFVLGCVDAPFDRYVSVSLASLSSCMCCQAGWMALMSPIVCVLKLKV